jgi:hypothetical protein
MAHSDLIGGSTAERVMNCTGSVELCRKMPEKGSSVYADRGTMLHTTMEKVLLEGADPLALIGKVSYEGQTLTMDLVEDKVLPALEAFDTLIDAVLDEDLKFRCEVRVGYSGLEAFGTTDILGATSRYAVVGDWKFGDGVKVSAIGSYQLRFYAGAAREMSPQMFEGKDIVLAIIQPGAPDGGLSWEIITHEELDQFVDEMKAALVRVAAGDTEVVSGKWCRWCAGAPICPAKKSAAQELVARHLDKTVDPAELGELATLATELEEWCRAVMALTHQELEKGRPVTGWKLVQKRGTRQWTDETQAALVFRSLGCKPAEFYESKMISPAQADKLLKAKGAPKAALDEVIVSRSSGTTLAPVSDTRPEVKSGFSGALNLPALS